MDLVLQDFIEMFGVGGLVFWLQHLWRKDSIKRLEDQVESLTDSLHHERSQRKEIMQKHEALLSREIDRRQVVIDMFQKEILEKPK